LRFDTGRKGLLPDGKSEEAASLNLHARGFSLREASGRRYLQGLVAMLFRFGYCLHNIIARIANHVTVLGFSATVAAAI